MMSLVHFLSRVFEKDGGPNDLWATIGRTKDRRTVACTAMPVNPWTLSRLNHGTTHPGKTGVLRRRAAHPHHGGQKTGSPPAHGRRGILGRTTAAACLAGRAMAAPAVHWGRSRGEPVVRWDHSHRAPAAHRVRSQGEPAARWGHNTSATRGHRQILSARRARPAEGSRRRSRALHGVPTRWAATTRPTPV